MRMLHTVVNNHRTYHVLGHGAVWLLSNNVTYYSQFGFDRVNWAEMARGNSYVISVVTLENGGQSQVDGARLLNLCQRNVLF